MRCRDFEQKFQRMIGVGRQIRRAVNFRHLLARIYSCNLWCPWFKCPYEVRSVNMGNCLANILAVGLLVSFSVFGWPTVASADLLEQTIKNTSTIRAFDLHVKFTAPFKIAPNGQGGWPHIIDPNAPGDPGKRADSISADGMEANFDSLPGEFIDPGQGLTIRFVADDGTKIDVAESKWSDVEHAKIINSVASRGQGPRLFFQQDSSGQFLAFAGFFNSEPVPLRYNNIRFFVNNNVAHFNLVDLHGFEVPTGQPVQGLPPQIILGPGQSTPPLPLGPIDPSGYVLGFATADTLDNPGEEYAVVTALAPQAPNAVPIMIVGFNADVIADLDPTVRFAHPFDANTFAWFEGGAVDDNGVQHNDGLPAGLNFTSPTGSGATYQIQPANGFNVLQLGPGQTGTLTLLNPGDYKGLYFIASSGDGTPSSAGNGIINFADGSTQIFIFNAFDWFNGPGGLHPEAVLPGPTGRGDVGSNGTAFVYNRDSDFQVYETVIPIDPWHAGVPILSIDFTGAPDAFYSNIFGVSGQ
jgi:hypothetical protein